MLKNSIFVALGLTLLACGGANQDTPAAPATPSETPVVDADAAIEPAEDQSAATADVDASDSHAGDTHADHDDHDSHEDHEDHEDHADHSDATDKHDHGDHAGGEAHVHGIAEVLVVIDGDTLSVTMESPLANFGVAESGDEAALASALTDALDANGTNMAEALTARFVPNTEAGCTYTGGGADLRLKGDHGAADVHVDFDCTRMDALNTLTVSVFDLPFESIKTVILDGDDQVAGSELTAANNALALR